MTDSRPIWWRATEAPPPAAWCDAFDALTTDELADHQGLGAGIYIARVRRRTGRGPTFSELFAEIFKDTPLHPEWPEDLTNSQRSAIRNSFRLHVAIQWKRRGWISWDPGVARSLRVGPTFRERSRARQAARAQ
ncbi:hypothetical protein GCM10007198_19180 [Microbacterium aerolatum]|uniref:Uncharacterized protein n=1 Tax=Microbacterium aerolatum TaxID=153731 RepID=A0A511AGN7_9MICO|nr:hypothetical protein MAE01_03630 [Microbacterium aerolatum]GGB28846.1 hypothetical protein GCM10007198_19180 [Microbacterium aerolatum]